MGIVIARYYGARNFTKIKEAVAATWILGGLLSIIVMLMGFVGLYPGCSNRFLDFGEITSPIIAGNDDPHAISNTKRKAYNQVKNGCSSSYCSQGFLAKKSPNNQDISCIIKLLKDIRQQDGKGKA